MVGVNSYFKFTTKSESEEFGYGHSLYHHAFLSYTKKYRGDYDYYTRYKLRFLSIENIETIFKKLDVHKVIILAFVDDIFRKQLNNHDKQDFIQLFYRTNRDISDTPSFIKYKIITNYKTEGYLLDEKYIWINDYEIDYNHSLFKKFGLNKIRVNEILLNLGAVESFNDLSIEQLTLAFEKFNRHTQDATGSQQFYKRALNHFDEHKLKLTRKVKLFARSNNKLALFNQEEIYFSDNNFLPSSLSSSYPIFNFPLRAGAKKAIEFFGIKDLSILKVIVLKTEPNDFIQHQFFSFYDDIKPYLLAYRLEDVESKEVEDDQVLRLNNLRFKFCKEVYCKIQDNEFLLTDYNYVYNSKDKTYYIKVPLSDTIELLKQNPLFVDNFSEILLNAFATTSEKPQFESVLRDTKITVEYNIQKALGDHAVEEAKILLGLVNGRRVFWNIIFQLKNISIPENDEQFEATIQELLDGMEFLISYDDINNKKNLPGLNHLFESLTITVSDFNKLSATKISTYQYNIKKLSDHLSSIESKIKQLIWDHLKNADQQKFLIKYFNSIELIKNKYENKKDLLENNFLSDYASINFSLLSEIIDFIDLTHLPSSISFWYLYKQNKKHFSEDQIALIENYPEINSLLYFDNVQPVKDLLKDLNPLKDENSQSDQSLDGEDNHKPNVREVAKFKTFSKLTINKNFSLYNPTIKNETQHKIIGNRAENLAYNKLVEMYGEDYVIHKSKETEWEHYDIKYSKDNGKSWIYVEVKSASLNKFTMTLWEKDFGENHADCYEIWVFRDGDFEVLTDFFANSPILNPTQFEIIFEEN